MKIDDSWAGEAIGVRSTPIFNSLPSHRASGLPAGGNQLFSDGSGRWIQFKQMYFLTTWKTAMTYNHRFGFFYQDPTDFDPALQQKLPSLAAPVYK